MIRRLFFLILKLVFRNKPNSGYNGTPLSKILILRYDAIGDMIVTTPLFTILKSRFPNTELHILCSNRNWRMIQFDKNVDKIFILPDKIVPRLFFLIKLRKEGYSVILNLVFSKTTKAGLISNLIGNSSTVKVSITHSDQKRNEQYKLLFNYLCDITPIRNTRSMVEIQTFFVSDYFKTKITKEETIIQIPLLEKHFLTAKEFLSNKNIHQYIILNISSGNEFRKWSVEKNAELISMIREKDDLFPIVIVYSPHEIHEAESIVSQFKNDVYFFDKNEDFLNVAALISLCDFVITPDTSITHISATYRKPTLVIYSLLASYLNEWVPYNCPYKAVYTSGRLPLSTIDTKTVYTAFLELMNETQI